MLSLEPLSPRLKRRRAASAALGVFLLVALLLPSLAHGQAETPPAPESKPTSETASSGSEQPSPTGWIGFEQIQFSHSLLGTVIIEDTDIGYAFTEHLSGDIGLPVIFTRSPFSPVTTKDYYWSVLWGAPYLDVKYTNVYHELKYTSVLTGTAPVTSEDRSYNTGRPGVDWFNHVEEEIGGVTPFLNIGASNGAVDRFIMPRPYTTARPYATLGALGDGEAGLEYRFRRGFVKGLSIGASAYALKPVGPQKVFSRYVLPYSTLAGDGNHYRYFDGTFETNKASQAPGVVALAGTTGTFDNCSVANAVVTCKGGLSSIARDNGYSAWIDVRRWRPLDVQLGYTHSVHYALDIYTVTINFDGRSLIRNLMSRQ